MAVTGYLSDFSLSELFKLLGQGRRTGLLTICCSQTMGESVMVGEQMVDELLPHPLSGAPALDADAKPVVAPAESPGYSMGPANAVGPGNSVSPGNSVASSGTVDARPRHLIWFYEGRIVAYVSRQGKQLSSLGDRLHQLSESGERAIAKMQRLRPEQVPLGQWLQSQGVLQTEQIQQLFREQVIQPITQLLTLRNGAFCFQRQARLPLTEMTGLSIPPVAVTLVGLRKLPLGSALSNQVADLQLPDTKTALISRCGSPVALQLTDLELNVWEAANGNRTLTSIGRKLKTPLPEVLAVAFRLNRAGLLDWSDTAFLGLAPGRLKSSFRRPWLPSVLSAIGRAEGRSPLAAPLPPAETHNDLGRRFSGFGIAAEPSTPEL